MCTNDRLVSQMEGYMDDLVDCFEEFVKKSMLVVSVAVGTLVLMVMYVVKLISERTAGRQITDDSAVDPVYVNNTSQVSTQRLTQNAAQNPGKNKDPFRNDFLDVGNMRTISLQVVPNTYPSLGPSYAESFMNEIDLGSKSFDTCKQTQVSDDLKSARPESKFMKTRQLCETKSHLSTSRRCSKYMAMSLERNSCCSICCEDDRCNKLK